MYWLPYVGFIGFIFFIVGAIFALLGRKPFGAAHGRNVIFSVVVFVVGIATLLVGSFIVGFAAALSRGPSTTQAQLAAALRDGLINVLIVAAIGTVVYVLSAVLFTHALQKREGRILLWAGYGAALGVQAALLVVVLPLIPGIADEAARQIFATGQVDPRTIANAFNVPTSGIDLLNAIPGILFAAVNYLAWSRINKTEIPVPPPAMPGPSPPAPPIQPR